MREGGIYSERQSELIMRTEYVNNRKIKPNLGHFMQRGHQLFPNSLSHLHFKGTNDYYQRLFGHVIPTCVTLLYRASFSWILHWRSMQTCKREYCRFQVYYWSQTIIF